MQQFFEVEQEITPLFAAGSLAVSEPVFVLNETGQIGTEFDTAARIDQVVYLPLKKGATHADMEAMGLTVEDNMKVFRSTTATETFFADVVAIEEHDEEFDLDWVETPPMDQSPHDLLFADYEV